MYLMPLQLFKGVSERGKWTRVLEDAERSYEAGDLDSALMVYLLLAEMGVEVAQTNAAYILEQGLVILAPVATKVVNCNPEALRNE